MAVTPYLFREATPGELETVINAVLVGILDQRILGVEVDAVQITPAYAKNVYTAITTGTDNASTITNPYVFKTFAAAEDAGARQLALNFMVANPAYFYSPIYAVYRPAVTDPNQSTVVALIYNIDATEGADNWGYVSAGGGGGTISGTIEADQVAVGDAHDSIAGSAAFKWTAAGGATANRTAVARNEMFGNLAGNTTMTGVDNTLFGYNAGNAIAGATGITAVGSGAFGGAMTVSSANSTAIGYNAMSSAAVASKGACTAVGANALAAVTASDNTAVGSNAGSGITASQRSTSLGSSALIGPGGTVSDSTAVGYRALTACQAQQNTAVGSDSADAVTTSSRIVAVGYNSLGAGTTGVSDSTALGFQALLLCTAAENTAIGSRAADAVTTSTGVVAVGYSALGAGSTGASNSTAIGHQALLLATAASNTAVGSGAGLSITTGAQNTAIGHNAMAFQESAGNLVGVGMNAVRGSVVPASNTGTDLVGVGCNTLVLNESGSNNTAIGNFVLDANTTGSRNSGMGTNALSAVATGSDSTAVGYNALLVCTASGITAIGSQALVAHTSGTNNVAVGFQSGFNLTTSSRTTSVGYQANYSLVAGGADSTAIGYAALGACTASGNTAVGSEAAGNLSASTRIVAVGQRALHNLNAGSDCTAVGYQALVACEVAEITAVGSRAADALTTSLRVTAIGNNALGAGTSFITDCTAVGHSALALANGSNNTAIGSLAGDAITSGASNTLVGAYAGSGIIGGTFNCALGDNALFTCSSGVSNAAFGAYALYSVSSGLNNMGIGTNAGSNLSTANNNVAVGYGALQYTTTDAQIAIGMEALRGNVTPGNNTGTFNVAIGFQAMRVNDAGSENVAIGYQALPLNTSGSRCVGIGTGALAAHLSGTDNTALGWQAGALMTSGSGNVFLGAGAGDNTDPTATGRMVVGSDLAYVGDIYFGNGEVNASTGGVVIHVTGGLGTDKDGGNLYIAGGIATGSGTPGFLAFQTSIPAGSSATPQTLETRMQLDDGGAVAGNTSLLLWDVDHGTLQRVTVGAADSGGTGFRLLRIPN